MRETVKKILLSWLRVAASEVPGMLPPYPLYFARGMLHVPDENEELGPPTYICPCCKVITYPALVGWELPHDEKDEEKKEPLLQCQTAKCGVHFFPP